MTTRQKIGFTYEAKSEGSGPWEGNVQFAVVPSGTQHPPNEESWKSLNDENDEKPEYIFSKVSDVWVRYKGNSQHEWTLEKVTALPEFIKEPGGIEYTHFSILLMSENTAKKKTDYAVDITRPIMINLGEPTFSLTRGYLYLCNFFHAEVRTLMAVMTCWEGANGDPEIRYVESFPRIYSGSLNFHVPKFIAPTGETYENRRSDTIFIIYDVTGMFCHQPDLRKMLAVALEKHRQSRGDNTMKNKHLDTVKEELKKDPRLLYYAVSTSTMIPYDVYAERNKKNNQSQRQDATDSKRSCVLKFVHKTESSEDTMIAWLRGLSGPCSQKESRKYIHSIIAIDFSSSNRSVLAPGGLHRCNMNLYEGAIECIWNTMYYYDKENGVSMYGLCAKVNGKAMDHFPLSIDGPQAQQEQQEQQEQGENSQANKLRSLDDVKSAYRKTIEAVQFHGPSRFAPFVESLDFTKSRDEFHVVFILTDGDISDTQQLIKEIERRAKKPDPVAFVFIIIGGDDGGVSLESLNKLDDNALRSHGDSVPDIVTCRRFKEKYINAPAKFSEAFDEIPRIFTSYFNNQRKEDAEAE